jgi:hypothetical protein
VTLETTGSPVIFQVAGAVTQISEQILGSTGIGFAD